MSEMKSMKAPQIEICAETHYSVRVAGRTLKGSFREVKEMCGMKQLVNERGEAMVVDVPDDFMNVINQLLNTKEYIKVSLIKAAPHLIDEMKSAVSDAKEPERRPIRRPVKTDGDKEEPVPEMEEQSEGEEE